MIIEQEAYLSHYGVLGMRWGVRNDKELAAKREAKAQKYVKKAAFLEKAMTDLNNASANTSFEKARLNKAKYDIREQRRQALQDAEAKRGGKLTDTQRKLLIGGAIVGGLLVAGGAYYFLNSGELNRSIMKGAAFLKGEKAALAEGEALWKANKDLAKANMSPDEILHKVVAPINVENYAKGAIGSKMNCRRCTFAYEMRRRGYDVAATRTTNAFGQNPAGLYNALRPGETPIKTSTAAVLKRIQDPDSHHDEATKFIVSKGMGLNDIPPVRIRTKSGSVKPGNMSQSIFAALKKQPNGSRGELGLQWIPGGGHSIAYEIIQGKPVLFDTQTGQVYKSASQLAKETEDMIGDAKFTRLDNVPLNNDFLLRWIKNA